MSRIPKSQFTEFNPKVYVVKKATVPHVLDGDIDKDFWKDAPFTDEFVDIEGDIRPAPRFKTRAKMLWDDNNFYFAAELMGDEIWAYVTEHDDVIFRDNDFEIFIDPDSDTHEYYEFEMNALNTVWDLLLTKPYRDNGRAVNSFDIKGLKTAVKIDGELNNPNAKNIRWTAEIVIPFETLKECAPGGRAPNPGEYWRVNFSRVHWTVDVVDGAFVKRKDAQGKQLPEDNWVWSPTGIIAMHYPELWGFVFFDEWDGKIPAVEYSKWELRKIYYALHAHYDEKGFFPKTLNELNMELPDFHIDYQVTSHLFELSCSCDGQKVLLISDGKVSLC